MPDNKAARGWPIVLPPYLSDGSGFDWSGRVVNTAAPGDLPIAHLRTHLVQYGCVVHQVGLQSNRASFPFRSPRVLLHYDAALIASQISGNAAWTARADALGLIVSDLTPSIWRDAGTRYDTRPLLLGQPAKDNGTFWELIDAQKYVGGRLLVVQDLPPDLYITTDQEDPAPETAFTATSGVGYGSCTGALGTPGSIDTTIPEPFPAVAKKEDCNEEKSADLEKLPLAAARFERLKVVFVNNQKDAETFDVIVPYTCKVEDPLTGFPIDTLVSSPDYTQPFDNAIQVATLNTLKNQAKALVLAMGLSTVSAVDSLSIGEILAFFEDDV